MRDTLLPATLTGADAAAKRKLRPLVDLAAELARRVPKK